MRQPPPNARGLYRLAVKPSSHRSTPNGSESECLRTAALSCEIGGLPRRRTILLFTRDPQAEARTKGLPVAAGARLFEAFLKGWRHRAAEAGAELTVVAPSSSVAALEQLFPENEIEVQQGHSFAARLESAFVLAFDRGADSVVMVGGDGPPLDLSDLNQAFGHLEAHERALVLAPSEDGGVNAIGCSARAERPFSGVIWQNSSVCRQLQSAAAEAGLELLLTRSGRDLDRSRDIRVLYRFSRSEACWSAFRWLLRALLQLARIRLRPTPELALWFVADSYPTRGPPAAVPFPVCA